MIAWLADAHNHLQDRRYGGRQAALLAEAGAAGVRSQVVNGTGETDWPAVAELAARHPEVIPNFGCHPWYLHERTAHWQTRLIQHLDATPRAGLGEIGLDQWILNQTTAIRGRYVPELAVREPVGLAAQTEAFEWQLGLAVDRKLPVTIHCLQAWGPLVAALKRCPRLVRGFLLHSYGGPKELIPTLVRLGAFFGFCGHFLHERKVRQREVFRHVPIHRVLVETDAPDQLLPDALNQYPLTDGVSGLALNHPANLPAVYAGLASILEMPIDDLAGTVAGNFERLFGAAGKR